jgi:excinuclease ABC subunit A
VQFQQRNISEVVSDSVQDALTFFTNMVWDHEADALIGETLRQEILSRLRFLVETGLSYLSLDRSAPTLSGGEAQRIRLAAQLGSNLCGVCYVLDEPTIGLHPRDNGQLLRSLRMLREKGNVVVVVEHDEDTIMQADHVIDLGPGAGSAGGCVIATGTPDEILKNPKSVTGCALATRDLHPISGRRRSCPARGKQAFIEVKGASLNNLKNIDVRFR